MTCQEFWNDPNPEASLHLRECAACTAAWEREHAVLAGLRTLRAEQSRVQAPVRVERRLIAAYQGHAGLGVNRVERMRPGWVPLVTWFSAAAALATVALLLVRDREPRPVPRSAPNAMHFAAAPQSPEMESAESGFIPLPNAAALDAGDEMNLVRLEFPRSAILAMGIEVSDDSAEEPVSADVMIGPDGVARAVRLLEE